MFSIFPCMKEVAFQGNRVMWKHVPNFNSGIMRMYLDYPQNINIDRMHSMCQQGAKYFIPYNQQSSQRKQS